MIVRITRLKLWVIALYSSNSFLLKSFTPVLRAIQMISQANKHCVSLARLQVQVEIKQAAVVGALAKRKVDACNLRSYFCTLSIEHHKMYVLGGGFGKQQIQ